MASGGRNVTWLGESREHEVVLFKRGLIICLLVSVYWVYLIFAGWYYGHHPWVISTAIPRYTLEGWQAVLPYMEAFSSVAVFLFLPVAYRIATVNNTQLLILVFILLMHLCLNSAGGYAAYFDDTPVQLAGYRHLSLLNQWPIFMFISFTPVIAVLTRNWWLPALHLCLCVLSLWRYFFTYFVVSAPEIVSRSEMISGGFRQIASSDLRWYLVNLAAVVVMSLATIFFIRYVTRLNLQYEAKASALSRYFSPAISKEIADGRLDLSADSHEEKPVAILFTDIAGFTKLSEQLSPSDTLKLLSEYQSLMVDAIFKYNGTVDKFIGDAVMANFGTPSSSEQDAENAFRCATEMNQKLAEWNEERRRAGLLEIKHRIGIHFGQVAVGNIGHEKRTEFAVIGDPVNVASRLCDAGKELGSSFVVSRDLLERAKVDVSAELVADFALRGRSGTLDVYKIQS